MTKKEFLNKKTVIYSAAVIMSLIWGLSFVALKVAFVELNPIQTITMRWTCAMLICAILVRMGVIKVKYRGKPLKLIIMAVLFQACFYSFLEAVGVSLTTITESAIIIAICPIVVVLLSIVFLKQKISLVGALCVFIAFGGVVVNTVFSQDFSLGGKWQGYLALIAAVLLGSAFTITSKAISTKGDFTPTEITVAMTFGGAIFFNAISLISGYGFTAYKVTFTNLYVFSAIIFLGAGCSVICYMILNYIIEKMPAHHASALQVNLVTITAVVAGVIIRGDDFGWYTVVGLIMMLGGIILLSRQEAK
ncbi:MAG: DMT family transporter, partial [Eubacteriales bacterium]|nr:DMT family transporter [Eubacteriales bacterium]